MYKAPYPDKYIYKFDFQEDYQHNLGFVFLYSKKLFVFYNDTDAGEIYLVDALKADDYECSIFSGHGPEMNSIYLVLMIQADVKWCIVPIMQWRNIDIEEFAFDREHVEFLWHLLKLSKELYRVELGTVPDEFKRFVLEKKPEDNTPNKPRVLFTPPFVKERVPISEDKD